MAKPPSDHADDETPTPSRPRRSRKAAADSADSSTVSAGSSPFVDEPGSFDPDAEPIESPTADPAGGQVYALPDAPPEWEREQVEQILTAQGVVVHTIVAVDKETDAWRYTENDLRAIAPPLTRILNRYDATRAAAGTGDEIALIIGLSGYVGRSWRTDREARAELRAVAPEPVSGVPAGGGGPTAAEPAAGGAPPVPIAESPVGSWEPPPAGGRS